MTDMKKTPMNLSALIAAGLTLQEASVWFTLAQGVPLNVTDISRKTDIHRPGVYGAIESLKKAKLVMASSGTGRVVYRAVGADLLAKRHADNNEMLLPQLQKVLAKESITTMPDDVCVYRGKDLQKVWEAVAAMPKGSVFYRYDGYAPGTPIEGTYMPKTFRDAVRNRRLERFVITNRGLRNAPFQKRLECASSVLPESFDAFEQGVTMFIFGDRMAMVDFNTESAYVIRNAALAAYHTKVFEYLYKQTHE